MSVSESVDLQQSLHNIFTLQHMSIAHKEQQVNLHVNTANNITLLCTC